MNQVFHKKEEDKSGGEHVNFVYNIGFEEKAASFCVDWATSAIHSDLPSQIAINWDLSGFDSHKTQLYQKLL